MVIGRELQGEDGADSLPPENLCCKYGCGLRKKIKNMIKQHLRISFRAAATQGTQCSLIKANKAFYWSPAGKYARSKPPFHSWDAIRTVISINIGMQ